MKQYNGHRSWNAWNVSLWIYNDECLYNFAMSCIGRRNNNRKGRNGAVREFMDSYKGQKTPDGAVYNHLSVKLALEGMYEDN